MLRPQACRWFDMVALRDDLAPLLETLARAGAVELQAFDRHAAPLIVGGADLVLARYHELARRSRGHWPPAGGGGARITDPGLTLTRRVAQLEAWQADADPLITEFERAGLQAANLDVVARLLAVAPAALPAPDLLAGAGRFLVELRVWRVAAQDPPPALPAEVMQLVLPAGEERFVLLVGRRRALDAAGEALMARQARRIEWPAMLHGSVAQASNEVQMRRRVLEETRTQITRRLEALARQHDLAAAQADIERVEWLLHHGCELDASERLVWVSGWTTAADGAALCAPLQRQGLACVVHFPPPPAGSEPPSVLHNPRWMRAFETFARMLGQPGRDEADPSGALVLIAPLLFGFMFGDVGQGALLVVAGWWLRRRVPTLVLLIPGGVMAMLFGWLFGSVFAREDLLEPLWLHPLRDPLVLLQAALALGAGTLLFGLLLNALQALWRHAGRVWLEEDAGLVLAYAGMLAAPWWPGALWLIPAGALWAALGTTIGATGDTGQGRAGAPLRGLAQFIEHVLQLAVNTVSFARVGAFALAHAGLSVAVTGLADASGPVGCWIVLALGNTLILVLEGLVVGIQTTRLLLFEFFVRFLQGRGRAFKPLPPPAFLPTT